MSYKLIRHSSKTLFDIQKLFEAVYGESPSLDYLRKKYDTSYTGKINLGYIAYDENNQPVASYTLWPGFLLYRGQKFMVAQSGDVLTHPSHRGKGLFMMVAKKAHELVIAEGLDFLFCFPNTNSYPGFIRHLGFVHPENLVQYRVTTKALPLIKAANKFKWFRPFYRAYFRILVKILAERTIIQNSVIDEHTAGMEHDQRFFDYKKYGNSNRVRVGNYSIWLKLEDGIQIGDISRFDEKDFDEFIKKLNRLSFWLGSHQFKIVASPGTFTDRIFRKKYLPESDYSVCIRDLGISRAVPLTAIKFVEGDLDTY